MTRKLKLFAAATVMLVGISGAAWGQDWAHQSGDRADRITQQQHDRDRDSRRNGQYDRYQVQDRDHDNARNRDRDRDRDGERGRYYRNGPSNYYGNHGFFAGW